MSVETAAASGLVAWFQKAPCRRCFSLRFMFSLRDSWVIFETLRHFLFRPNYLFFSGFPPPPMTEVNNLA